MAAKPRRATPTVDIAGVKVGGNQPIDLLGELLPGDGRVGGLGRRFGSFVSGARAGHDFGSAY